MTSESAQYHGSETVLIAEDDEVVRNLLCRTLGGCGYNVLSATDGRDALTLCQQHQGPIDLLVADVVMPQMSGVKLASQLRKLKPTLRVLYVSGYADEAIVRHGVSVAEENFLRKPCLPNEFADKVRETLDRRA